MNSYSKLQQNTNWYTTDRWHNIPQTQYTRQQRNKIKPLLDNFTSFSWRGVDAWDTFGAFILNEKNSLKFFEGPQWKNEYTKPQFSTHLGQLSGMSFSTPSISFSIGVYWFSEEEYRYLLDWLNPYEINELSFGFAPDYHYQVKLASISQGTRYVLGKEPTSTNNSITITSERYYTEIKLTFDLQGPACAYSNDIKTWQYNSNTALFENNSNVSSNLNFPIKANIKFQLVSVPDTTTSSHSIITLGCQYDNQEIELFTCVLENLPYGSGLIFNLEYSSEDGLVYWNNNGEKIKLLSSLSTLSTGKRFVRQLITSEFELPGNFTFANSQLSNFKFYIINSDPNNINIDYAHTYITGRLRTNVI